MAAKPMTTLRPGKVSRGDKPVNCDAYEVLCDSRRNRSKWLAMRNLGIGASDAGSVLGCSPWKSPYTLFMERSGAFPVEDISNKPAVEWGTRLERLVAEKFAQETGRAVFGGGWLLRSRAYPWLLATPDFGQTMRLRSDDGTVRDASGLLEIKTAGANAESYWEDGAPVYYQCQLQQQLLVTGMQHGSIAVLIGGQTFRYFDYERNDRFVQTLVDVSRDFWDGLQAGRPPPRDHSESTAKTLSLLGEQASVVMLPEEALDLHRVLTDAAAREVAARDEKLDAQRRLKALLGLDALGLVPGLPGVAYSFRTRKQYTVSEHTVRAQRVLRCIQVPKNLQPNDDVPADLPAEQEGASP